MVCIICIVLLVPRIYIPESTMLSVIQRRSGRNTEVVDIIEIS